MHDRPATTVAVPDVRSAGNDLDRSRLDPLVLVVDQQVALQAVREVEDDPTPGVLEGVALERVAVEDRPERELEEIGGPIVRLKVVALPVGAEGCLVALDHPVVAGDPAGDEARARQADAEEVALHVDVEPAFQDPGVSRQVEDRFVERRPRRRRDEPVGADKAEFAARESPDLARKPPHLLVACFLVIQPVRIAPVRLIARSNETGRVVGLLEPEDFPPEVPFLPAEVTQVHNVDRLVRVD